jgi:hypothetical protein
MDVWHEGVRIINTADCHDHRALHSPDKGVHPPSESTPGKATGRCAHRTAFAHNPQFNRSQLSPALHSARLHYRYLPGLGGFRRARPDSLNTGWHNASFRGFADYMQTPEFRKHLDDLIKLAKSERIAIMCAEAVPWRCHRSLIADALLARGIEVQEITSVIRTLPHTLTPWGKINGTQVTYPVEHTD